MSSSGDSIESSFWPYCPKINDFNDYYQFRHSVWVKSIISAKIFFLFIYFFCYHLSAIMDCGSGFQNSSIVYKFTTKTTMLPSLFAKWQILSQTLQVKIPLSIVKMHHHPTIKFLSTHLQSQSLRYLQMCGLYFIWTNQEGSSFSVSFKNTIHVYVRRI